MSYRRGLRAVVTAIVAMVIVAACGAADAPDRASVGQTGLDRPPFTPSAASRIAGIGGDRLLLVDGRRVATYDFRDARWRRHPDAPFDRAVTITHVDDTAVLIDWQCRTDCDQEDGKAAGFDGAVLDLADDGAQWHRAHLDLPPSSAVGAELLPYGQVGDEQVLGQSGLLAIDRELRVRMLADPPAVLPDTGPYQVCVTAGRGLVALVGDPTAPAPTPLWPTFGPSGDARLVALGADGRWTEVAGSSTRGVGTDVVALDRVPLTTACAPEGPLVAAEAAATARWTGDAWTVTPRGPSGLLYPGATFTPSGTVVASGGPAGVQVWKDGGWGVLPIPPDAPRGSVVQGWAVVGNRIVVLHGPPDGTATLSEASP